MKLLHVISSSILFLAMSSPLYAITFQLDHYPASLVDCQREARSLASNLSSQFGVEVTRSECSRGNGEGMTIKFQIKEPTKFSPFIIMDDDNSEYLDQEQCQEDLAAQSALFQRVQKIPAAITYCSTTGRMVIASMTSSYFDQTPRQRFWGEHSNWHVSLNNPKPKEVLASLTKGLETMGYVVSKGSVTNDFYRILYYSKQEAQFGFYREAAFSGMDECLGAQQQVLNAMRAINGRMIWSDCFERTDPGENPNHYLVMFGDVKGTFSTVGTLYPAEYKGNSVYFSDWSECQNQFDAVLASTRLETKLPIKSGFCRAIPDGGSVAYAPLFLMCSTHECK